MKYITYLLLLPLAFFSCNHDEFKNNTEIPELLDSARNAETKPLKSRNNGRMSMTTNSNFASPYYVFHKGITSKKIYKSLSDDEVIWNETSLGNDAYAEHSPAAVYYKDKIILFYAGRTDNKIYTSSSEDGINWGSDRQLGSGQQTDQKVCACEFKGRLYVFFRGDEVYAHGTRNFYYSYSDDGVNWSGNNIFYSRMGSPKQSGPSCAVLNNRMHIFITHDFPVSYGVAPYILQVTTTDFESFNEDKQLFLGEQRNDNSAAVVYKNKLYLFVMSGEYGISEDGYYWNFSYSIPGNASDSRWATVINNKLYVFHNGPSQKIHYSYSTDGIYWTEPRSIGNQETKSSPTAVSVLPSDQSEAQQNFALNATVSAQTTFWLYSVGKIIDGDRNTTVGPQYSWANDFPSGRLPQWIVMDFHQPVEFNRIELYTSDDYEIGDYEFQYSNDGVYWTTIVRKQNPTSANHQTHVLPTTVFARYLRTVCYAGSQNQIIYARINELEVYKD